MDKLKKNKLKVPTLITFIGSNCKIKVWWHDSSLFHAKYITSRCKIIIFKCNLFMPTCKNRYTNMPDNYQVNIPDYDVNLTLNYVAFWHKWFACITLDKSHIYINIHVNIIMLHVHIIYFACRGVESMPSISMSHQPELCLSSLILYVKFMQLWGGMG